MFKGSVFLCGHCPFKFSGFFSVKTVMTTPFSPFRTPISLLGEGRLPEENEDRFGEKHAVSHNKLKRIIFVSWVRNLLVNLQFYFKVDCLRTCFVDCFCWFKVNSSLTRSNLSHLEIHWGIFLKPFLSHHAFIMNPRRLRILLKSNHWNSRGHPKEITPYYGKMIGFILPKEGFISGGSIGWLQGRIASLTSRGELPLPWAPCPWQNFWLMRKAFPKNGYINSRII